MVFVLYCDESGNTGANFLDDDQPIFVLGGWLFERNKSYQAKNLIEKLKREQFQQGDELKGGRLLKSQKGQKFCVEVIEKLYDLGGIPFNIVVDKRFLVYAKIVDWFLDPEYNCKLNMNFLWDNTLRKDIADILLYACSQCEDIFKIVYKTPTIDNVMKLNQLIINELRKQDLKKLADFFDNKDLDYKEIVDEILIGINSEQKSAMATINYTAFNAFINLVEQFGRNMGLKNVRFYHDEVAQFAKAFPSLFELYKNNSDESTIKFLNGNEIIFSATTIKVFEMRDSKKNYLIQAADILSSTLNYTLTEKYKERELNSPLDAMEKFIKRTIFLSASSEFSPFVNYIVSKKFIEVFNDDNMGKSVGFAELYKNVIDELEIYANKETVYVDNR